MQQIKMLAALCVVFLVLESCGSSSPKIMTARFAEYTLPDSTSQTKQNVTIEVEVLNPTEMQKFPTLFAFQKSGLRSPFDDATYPEDSRGRNWCYTFGVGEKVLTACKVKLTNRTPHILRMKDSRIYLIVSGESPIAAIAKLGTSNLVSVGKDKLLPKSYTEADESLVDWLTRLESEAQERTGKQQKGFTKKLTKGITLGIGSSSSIILVGFRSQVVDQNKRYYKLINDLAVEILPGFSYDGILVFPVTAGSEGVKLSFFDIITKTDPAGNPVEKTSFEFPLKSETVDVWYDQEDGAWKKGEPPTVMKK